MSVSNRGWIGASLALSVVIFLAVVSVAVTRPDDVRFAPEEGDQRQYRVELRERVDDGGERTRRPWFMLQSVLAYRVSGADPMPAFHVSPRFMRAETDDGLVFSSAQPNTLASASIAPLMRAGFDLTLRRDLAGARLQASDDDAWRMAMTQSDAPLERIAQQFVAPALGVAIPARAGAQVDIPGFRGMPALRLTVTDVEPDSLIATVARLDEASAAGEHTLPAAGDAVTDVSGRLQIDRDSGWIRAMTLISARQGDRAGRRERRQRVLTMQAVDDPATGTLYDALEEFRTNTLVGQLADYALDLPRTAAEAPGVEPIEIPPTPLAHADTRFAIDDEDGALVLTIVHHDDENLWGDLMTLEGLTLRNAAGETLDKGFVLDWVGGDLEREGISKVRLLPLGWDNADLSDIAEVDARFRYQPTSTPTPIELPLRETPTRREDAATWAEADPIEADPIEDGWIVTLSGRFTDYYIHDYTGVFEGRSAMMSDRRHNGMTPSDRALYDRVGDRNLWLQQIVVKGDIDAFPLLHFDDRAPATTHELTFTRSGSAL